MLLRRLWLLCVVLALAISATSQTRTLQGTMQNPDGSLFNGSITLKLGKSTVTNICVTPVQVVAFAPLTVKVVNGVVTPTSVISTDCLVPRLPYAVTVAGSNNVAVYSDNWYVPLLASSVADVGQFASTRLAAAITVSVPQAIVATPVGAQTITEPGSYYLNVNNLNVTGLFTVTGTFSASNLSIGGTLAVSGNTTLSGSLSAASIATSGTLSSGALTASTITSAGLANVGSLEFGGSPGSAGQCLGVGGVYLNCLVSSSTIYYQTVQAATTSRTQRTKLNFLSPFTVTDNGSNGSSDIGLAASGVTAGSYTFATVTVDSFGRVTSASAGGVTPTCTDVTGSRSLGSSPIANSGTGQLTVFVTAYISGSYGQGFGMTSQVGPSGSLAFFSTAGIHNDSGQATLMATVPVGDYYEVYQDNTYVSNPQTPHVSHWIECQY